MSSIKSLKDRDATFWTVYYEKKKLPNYPIHNTQEAKLHSDITVDTTHASDTTYIHTTGVKKHLPMQHPSSRSSSWWVQPPLNNMLIKMGSSSPNRDENNKLVETTTRRHPFSTGNFHDFQQFPRLGNGPHTYRSRVSQLLRFSPVWGDRMWGTVYAPGYINDKGQKKFTKVENVPRCL